MANIALIIAGGVGARMHQSIPKQFISVFDKPVIVYTLERFQLHNKIDTIAVVCLQGWESALQCYANQYGITKLKHIVKGGGSGQESIKNGLDCLSANYPEDSLVLIHDAIRPMVSEEVISDCINIAKLNGNAVACIPCQEAMMVCTDGKSSNSSILRDELKRSQTPQCFKLGELIEAHNKAKELQISNSISSCVLFTDLGKTIFISQGSEKNLKLTTQEDMDIFKALLKA